MSDERPRPQYGEYAPDGWVSPYSPVPDSTEAPLAAEQVVVEPVRKRRTWDTVLTFALLGVGLYTVLSGYVGFSQLSDVFDQMFTQLGIGEFTNVDAANTAGVIASIAQTVIWVIAAVGAGISLQRGRLAFWWPLAGGVLANLILVILVGVVMASDPAYAEYVTQMSQ